MESYTKVPEVLETLLWQNPWVQREFSGQALLSTTHSCIVVLHTCVAQSVSPVIDASVRPAILTLPSVLPSKFNLNYIEFKYI